MNVAFFSESYKPYISGVTNSMETLKSGLEELGHRVLVFSPNYPSAKKEKDIYRFPSLPSTYPGYRLAIPMPGRTLNILKESGVEIIHSHSPYQLGQLSRHYARKLKIPYVFTMHTLLSQYMHYVPFLPEDILINFTSAYIKSFCNRVDCVITPTNKVSNELRSIGVRTRIEVVPTGMDMALAEKADPKGVRYNHGIPKHAKVLLFVGRLAKEKNLDFLLKAFEAIRGDRNDLYLLIAAGGPMNSELKGRGIRNAIFAGAVGYPEIFNYYAASDIFVFSSLSETQGLVLAEAMACGIPQVAVAAQGVSDVVVDGVPGFVTKESIDDFAAKVSELLSDDILYLKMSQGSRSNAQKVYSKEAFARKIEQVYKSVI